MNFKQYSASIWIALVLICVQVEFIAAQTYLTGVIRDFPASGDFARTELTADTSPGLLNAALTNGKPTRTNTVTSTISNFNAWFGDALDSFTATVPYTWTLNLKAGSATRYEFDSSAFYPINGRGLEAGQTTNNRYFTAEVTTVFIRPNSGDTNPSLTFTTQDDMWVYLNGALVVDLGGINTTPRSATIQLSNFLTLGQRGEMKIFYAHRSTRHAPYFHVESLAPSECDAGSVGTPHAGVYPFATSNLALKGPATIDTGASPVKLDLLQQQTDTGVAAWHKQLIPVTNGFRTSFRFRINKGSATNAEGLAFVIQRVGDGAGGLEGSFMFYNVPNSIAVEFDTKQDNFDPDGNHIAVMTRYSSTNSPQHSSAQVSGGVTSGLSVSMDDGTFHTVEIVYTPGSSSTGKIRVSLDGAVRIAAASVDNTQIRSIFTNGLAYMGFTTSSSSSNTADIDVDSWRVWQVGASGPRATLSSASLSLTASDTTAPADVQTLQARDACGSTYSLSAGTPTMQLRNSSNQVVVANGVEFTNNLDGTYAVSVHATVAGPYNLSISVDSQAITASPIATTIVAGPANAARSTYEGTGLSAMKATDVRQLSITARDQYGNIRAASSDSFVVQYSNSDPISRASFTGGKHVFNLQNTAAGTVALFIRLGGQDIANSPLTNVVVSAGAWPGPQSGIATSSKAGAGLVSATAGVQTSFIMTVFDTYGNQITSDAEFTTKTVEVCTRSGGSCVANSLATSSSISFSSSAFQVSYTPRASGINTITIKLNGVDVDSTPTTVSVLPGALNVTASSFTVASTAVAGSSHEMTIQAKDVFGNDRSEPNPSGVNFIVEMTRSDASSVSYTCPSSDCSYLSGGKYLVSTVQTLTGAYSARVISNQSPPEEADKGPKAFSITPSLISPTKSFVRGIEAISAGQFDSFRVYAQDQFNNSRGGSADINTFTVSIGHLTLAGVGGAVNSTTALGNGQYDVRWTATVAGSYSVSVRISGSNVGGSPQTKAVSAAATDAKSTVLSGDGASGGVSATNVTLSVQARDQYHNNRPGTTDPFTVTVRPLVGAGPVQTPSKEGGTNGLYTFTYLVPTFASGKTQYFVEVYLSGQLVTNVTAFVAQNSASSFATVSGSGASQAVAGTVATFVITNRDSGGVPLPYNADQNFAVVFDGPSSIVPSVVDNQNGNYTVQYLAEISGEYNITVKSNGIVPTNESPVKLTVAPGAVSALQTAILDIPTTSIAGFQTTYRVFPKDANGNAVINSGFQFTFLWEPAGLTGRSISQQQQGDGSSYQISFTAFNATSEPNHLSLFTLLNGQVLGNPGERKIVVLPSSPSYLFTTVEPTSIAVAGSPATVDLIVRDVYQNPINFAATSSLSYALENNTAAVFSTQYLLIDGRFRASFTPTNTSGNPAVPLKLRVFVSGSEIPSSPILLTVYPAAPDSQQSSLTSFEASNVVAKVDYAFNLNIRDRFGNPWFNDFTQVQVRVTDGPTGGFPVTLGVTQVGGGGYRVSWTTPVIASSTPSPNKNYTLSFEVAGSPLSPTNLAQVTVVPGVTDATKTVVPPLTPSVISAGNVARLRVQLVDVANNPKVVGGETVRARYYAATDTTCSSPLTFGDSSVKDNGNGTYDVVVSTTIKGQYKLLLDVQVQGTFQLYRPCSQAVEFTVVPLAAFGATSLIQVASQAVAGIQGTALIVLRDKYSNTIEKGGQNITLGVNPSDVTISCPEGGKIVWFREPFVNITVNDLNNGQHRIQFTAIQAREYSVVATVNNQFIGTPSFCFTIEVSPWYPYRFNISLGNNPAVAAQKDFFEIQSFDIYGNQVKSSNHTFTVTLSRFSGVDTIASYKLSADVGQYRAINLTHTLKAELLHLVNYTTVWSGIFNVSTEIKDPLNDGFPRAFKSLSASVSVTPATCGTLDIAKPYRCPTGECVANYEQCAGTIQCPVGMAWCKEGNSVVCSRRCSCPSPLSYCDTLDTCVESGACPQYAFAQCPSRFPVRCPGNLTACRATLEDCPSVIVCPPGLIKCPDGRSCAPRNGTCHLPSRTAACSGAFDYRCPDGSCVNSAEECSTPVSCGNRTYTVSNTSVVSFPRLVCADGECVVNSAHCRNQYTCDSNQHRCPDGSCRSSIEDCPTAVTCPIGYVKCEQGVCARTLSECQPASTCAFDKVRCPDGSCARNLLLCPTGVTCSAANPVKCNDGSCVRSVQECRQVSCPTSLPARCPDGSCRTNVSECASGVLCSVESPVLCSDLTCVKTRADCKCSNTDPSSFCVDRRCPEHAPVRCADSSCVADSSNCPTRAQCPSTRPVQCPDGSCQVAPAYCAAFSQVECPSNWHRCPGGGCSPHFSLCPTVATCPVNTRRCADGTCRSSCSGGGSVVAECTTDQIACPQYLTGVSCSNNITNCPQSFKCPEDEPVLCYDGSCRSHIQYCPQVVEPGSRVACAAGFYEVSLISCGTSTTCPPSAPYKCYDQTCRKAQKDCPKPLRCPSSTPHPCPDGTCRDSPDSCGGAFQCKGDTPVMCPWITQDTRATSGCVSSVSQCEDIFDNPTERLLFCPNFWGTRCRDSSCKNDELDCAELTCPPHLPHRCFDGLCTKSESECPDIATSCPARLPKLCPSGTCVAADANCDTPANNCSLLSQVLCPDGNCASSLTSCLNQGNGCAEGEIRCADGRCVFHDPSATTSLCNSRLPEANFCPAMRPYRCDNGFCAASSALCAIMPVSQTGCTPGRPVQCANGQCVESAAQCPYVFPCESSDETVRCADGSCRRDAEQCSAGKTFLCPSNMVRCPNGTCAVSGSCPTRDSKGCPRNLIPCPGPSPLAAGQCVSDVGSCTQLNNLANGCPRSLAVKCSDGSCAANADNCPSVAGCPFNLPIKCSNGVCVSNPSDCHTATCKGVVCPHGTCAASLDTCLTTQLCPASAPVRCADGSCKKFPASAHFYAANVSETCAPTVTCHSNQIKCADHECVPEASLCRPLHPCPGFTDVLCGDKISCAPSLAQCRHNETRMCPAASPVLCPDGSCRERGMHCPETEAACTWPTPFRCFDGSCSASMTNCWQNVAATYRGTNGSAACTARSETCVCPAGQAQCFDGSCAVTAAACPLAPPCPLSHPFHCPGGSCGTSAADCQNVSPCGSGTLCDDGSCRTTCPETRGCSPGSFYCPTNVWSGRSECSSACFQDKTLARLPCANNASYTCLRSVQALRQSATVPTARDISIDVAMDPHIRIVRTKLHIPSGALGSHAPVEGLTILPVAPSRLRTTFSAVTPTRQAEFGQILPQAQTQLSPAFMCAHDPSLSLKYSLQVESYIDFDGLDAFYTSLETQNNKIPVATRMKDVCLARLSTNNDWQCLQDFPARLTSPAWVDDGRPRHYVTGSIASCMSGGQSTVYAFVFSPFVGPAQSESEDDESTFEKNKGAIIAGLVSGLVFLLAMLYVGSRLIRYKQKYDRKEKELAELEEKAREIEEYGGGLGIAGDDVEMQVNPLVVQMRALEDQLLDVNQTLGVQAQADDRQIEELNQKKLELQAQVDAVKRRLELERMERANVAQSSSRYMEQPRLPTNIKLEYNTSGALSSQTSSQSRRQKPQKEEFTARAKRKQV